MTQSISSSGRNRAEADRSDDRTDIFMSAALRSWSECIVVEFIVRVCAKAAARFWCSEQRSEEVILRCGDKNLSLISEAAAVLGLLKRVSVPVQT